MPTTGKRAFERSCRERAVHMVETPGRGSGRSAETSSTCFVCPSIHLPAPRARDEAFLQGHVPVLLSLGGLRAPAGRFPFMYKGPLIQSDERKAAVGTGGDTSLGICTAQCGGHRASFLQVGLLSRAPTPWTQPLLASGLLGPSLKASV